MSREFITSSGLVSDTGGRDFALPGGYLTGGPVITGTGVLTSNTAALDAAGTVQAGGQVPWTPNLIAGLEGWHDASQLALVDGASVPVWTNVGTGAASWMVGTPLPVLKTGVVGGKPVVRFTANEGRLRNTFSHPFEHTVVYISRRWGANGGRCFTAPYPEGANHLIGYHISGYDCMHDDGGWIVFPVGYPAAGTDPWRMYGGDGKPSEGIRFFVFGELRGSGLTQGNYGPGYNIGGYALTTAEETGDFDVAEVLVYDTKLSEDDRQKVEGYLAWKYGLQGDLLVGHPYKDAAPTTGAPPEATGTGALTAGPATVAADGLIRATGTAALTTGTAAIVSAGIIRAKGTADLASLDSVLSGVGAAATVPWTPDRITTGMFGWWDASDASSLTWSGINLLEMADQGPGGIHMGRASSSGPTAATLNGRGALAFTYDQGLMTPVATTFGDYTIFAVFNPGFSDGNTYERIVDHSYAEGWWFGRTGGTQTFGGGIQDGPGTQYGIFVPLANNEVHLISNVREGIIHKIGGNGGAVTNSRAIHTNVTASNRVYMAQDNLGLSDVTDGEIGEVIIWHRALPADEMALVEGYLAWKWGIQDKLPVGHAYKNAAPGGALPVETAGTGVLVAGAAVLTGAGTLGSFVAGSGNLGLETPVVSPVNMVSNTSPAPFVVTSSNELAGYLAFNAFDNNEASVAHSNDSLTQTPYWIKIDLGAPKFVDSYRYQARNVGPYHCWKTWQLHGSNNDIDWTLADTVVGEANFAISEMRGYVCDTPGSFRYWRWSVTATGGISGTYAEAATLRLYGPLGYVNSLIAGDGSAKWVFSVALPASPAALIAAGLSRSIGTGTASVGVATATGAGISRSIATGTPAAQSATLVGAGLVQRVGTGALIVASTAQVTGIGTATTFIGGALYTASAQIAGAGISATRGTGVLPAQTSVSTAVGVSLSHGSALLADQPAALASSGLTRWTTAVALSPQAATVAASGATRWIAAATLPSQAATLAGAGNVGWAGIGALVSTAAAAGQGISSSTAIAPLQMALATIEGIQGIEVVEGRGEPRSRSAQIDAHSISRSFGFGTIVDTRAAVEGEAVGELVATGALQVKTRSVIEGTGKAILIIGGAIKAQAAKIAGVGISRSRGTGTVINYRSAVQATALGTSRGSGVLTQTGRAAIMGVGRVIAVGTGDLIRKPNRLVASGLSRSIGTGALPTLPHQIAAAGVSISGGPAVLASTRALLAASGRSLAFGTGLLDAKANRIVASGLSGSIASGVLIVEARATVTSVGFSIGGGPAALVVGSGTLTGRGLSQSLGLGDLPSKPAIIDGYVAHWTGTGDLAAGQSSIEGWAEIAEPPMWLPTELAGAYPLYNPAVWYPNPGTGIVPRPLVAAAGWHGRGTATWYEVTKPNMTTVHGKTHG